MRKLTTIGILLIGLSLGSCSNFLDVKPSNSGDASSTIVTLNDAKVMTNGLMRNMLSSNYYGRNFILYGDVKGGDITIASQGRGADALYTFNHSANNNSFSGFWTSIHSSILQANNIIESINALEKAGSSINFKNYKGQALTLRALMHFDLVRLYGKSYTDDPSSLGIPITTSLLPANAQPTRATVEETYTQILADLLEAEPLLLKEKSNGYINFFANKAIQARVYLTMGNYEAALAAAETIIQSNAYRLYLNSEWVSSWSRSFGTESIFELGMFPNEGDLGTTSLAYYFMALRDRNANGLFMASDYYLDRLHEDPTDVRWGILKQDELHTASHPHQGAIYKYAGSTTLSGDGKEPFTAVNIKVIRLSEIYLIAAEAALMQAAADAPKAAQYTNVIRQRAAQLAPLTSENISQDLILAEKSKELAGEGHRFFDLIRANKSITFNDEYIGLNLTHRPKTIDRSFNRTILPISIDELNANPALIPQQNPGY